MDLLAKITKIDFWTGNNRIRKVLTEPPPKLNRISGKVGQANCALSKNFSFFNPVPPSDAVRKQKNLFQRIFQFSIVTKKINPLET